MIFDRNEQKVVVALLGAGSMGTAIVRRIGAAGERLAEGERGGICTEGSRTGPCDVLHRYGRCITQSGQS